MTQAIDLMEEKITEILMGKTCRRLEIKYHDNSEVDRIFFKRARHNTVFRCDQKKC